MRPPGLPHAEPEWLAVLHELRARQPMPAVIVITGADEDGVRESCMRAGAAGFLNKPLSRDTLSSAIEAVECGWRPRPKRLS
ncbi:response regulator [Sinorhizobium meliloti]|uniref:response regulator n=1 Tax=Rhizobium meliloti TaxID=382 RepID=UPI002277817F|nr:response regulator [Sinorhizobium meliloti]